MLPELGQFFHAHAVLYLKSLGQPTPSEQQPAASFHCCEQLQPPKVCQSKSDGRNGSNGCTLILAVFVRGAKFLQSALRGRPDVGATAMCTAMQNGNTIYDSLQTSPLSEAHASNAAGGVFVFTLFSFSMCCFVTNFYVFNSRSHGGSEALMAKEDISCTHAHRELFFANFSLESLTTCVIEWCHDRPPRHP